MTRWLGIGVMALVLSTSAWAKEEDPLAKHSMTMQELLMAIYNADEDKRHSTTMKKKITAAFFATCMAGAKQSADTAVNQKAWSKKEQDMIWKTVKTRCMCAGRDKDLIAAFIQMGSDLGNEKRMATARTRFDKVIVDVTQRCIDK